MISRILACPVLSQAVKCHGTVARLEKLDRQIIVSCRGYVQGFVNSFELVVMRNQEFTWSNKYFRLCIKKSLVNNRTRIIWLEVLDPC